MAKKSIAQQRSELEAENKKLDARCKKLREERDKISERQSKIRDELHHLSILELVGKPNGVKPRYRYSTDERQAVLNDATGTVLEVRRTRALVDFGAAGKWNMYIVDLATIDAEQGMFFNL